MTDINDAINQVIRERDQALKDRDDALNRWTTERERMMNQLRNLRKRERVLISLLTDYLSGELEENMVVDRLEKATA